MSIAERLVFLTCCSYYTVDTEVGTDANSVGVVDVDAAVGGGAAAAADVVAVDACALALVSAGVAVRQVAFHPAVMQAAP